MAQEKPETVVYVSNCGDPSISVLAFDRAKGDVELIEKIDIPGAEKPSPTSMPLALSPDRRFLYAALRSEPFTVVGFAIDPAERQADPSAQRAARSEHGLYRRSTAPASGCWQPPIPPAKLPSTRSARTAR